MDISGTLPAALPILSTFSFPRSSPSPAAANQGETLLAPLREKVRAATFGHAAAVRSTRIELCTLGYRAGVIGAAMLARP